MEEQPFSKSPYKQDGRYNKAEHDIIKSVFSNEELLVAIQKSILQLDLSALDLSNLQVNITSKPEVQRILRKMLLPQLDDKNVPFNQIADLAFRINFKEKMADDTILHIKANTRVIKYIDQQLKIIESASYNKKPTILLKKLASIKGKEDKDIFIDTLARNLIIGVVTGNLTNLFIEAVRTDKSPQQLEEERRLNSSK